MAQHPEFAAEQRHLSWAYACLERMRESARLLQYSVESNAGGTHQARFERDVVEEAAMFRLAKLQLGGESLLFGRIDRLSDQGPGTGERFYIGRLPVSDAEQNPVVVDWRAPVAEAFYRATGHEPLGLERRRHFATEAERLVSIDDEVFNVDRLEHEESQNDLVGTGALLAALGRARRGQMRDIVATIQREQDEIIRSELSGALVVQGGPGTGKTAVALHRTAYLLYSHRFPLERQGVLVVGPNRLFMRYIGRVLPALGEHAVDLASIDELVADVPVTGTDSLAAAKVKGDVRMAKVLRRAVLTRQRPLKEPLKVRFGVTELTVSVPELDELVQTVKRAHKVHNPSRKQLIGLLVDSLADKYRDALARFHNAELTFDRDNITYQLRKHEDVRAAVDRMWPLLTPTVLLRDLFGAPALIKAAAGSLLSEVEQKAIGRPRGGALDDVQWTSADIALLDEAATFLGPLPSNAHVANAATATQSNGKHKGVNANDPHEEGVRTYGHLIVDEAQDLSPMQLRMLGRRSLNGSMTIVGDIGQATGMWAPKSWNEVLAFLPVKKTRFVELTVGYRAPAEVMALAAKVLAVAAPDLTVPKSVRSIGEPPAFVTTKADETLQGAVVRAYQSLKETLGEGTVGVLCPIGLVEPVSAALNSAGITLDPYGSMGDGVGVIAVTSAKGLEFDGVVVVEPAAVVRESAQGLRSLYVAITRATRLLAVVSSEQLPDALREG